LHLRAFVESILAIVVHPVFMMRVSVLKNECVHITRTNG
jgi:hypothetical protein